MGVSWLPVTLSTLNTLMCMSYKQGHSLHNPNTAKYSENHQHLITI